MYVPGKPSPMPAGHYPAHVEAACLVCEVKPEDLLAWSVRNDAVVLVLPSGQKVVFWVEGKWHGKQAPLPWEGEEEERVETSPPAPSPWNGEGEEGKVAQLPARARKRAK